MLFLSTTLAGAIFIILMPSEMEEFSSSVQPLIHVQVVAEIHLRQNVGGSYRGQQINASQVTQLAYHHNYSIEILY